MRWHLRVLHAAAFAVVPALAADAGEAPFGLA